MHICIWLDWQWQNIHDDWGARHCVEVYALYLLKSTISSDVMLRNTHRDSKGFNLAYQHFGQCDDLAVQVETNSISSQRCSLGRHAHQTCPREQIHGQD